jgi:hypothetical protein
VRGKDEFRNLVGAGNVADYLQRIRAIGKATGPEDFAFAKSNGKPACSASRSSCRSRQEMIGFAAQRLMEFGIENLTGESSMTAREAPRSLQR